MATASDNPALYRGAEEGPEREAREALVDELTAAGVPESRIVEAVEQERLSALPAELVLEGDTPYTLTNVARESGLDPRFLRRVLLALGRPNPSRGERAFSEDDVEEARILRQLLDAGLPREGVVQVARVIGQGMGNTALAVRELVAEALLGRGDTEHEVALRYQQAAEELGPLVGPLLGHELRAHIRDVIRREAVSQAERRSGRLQGTRTVSVAFADLVNFTKLGRELAPTDLGAIAGRLGDLATAEAHRPVQLVKTIGDAVMLVSPEPGPLLDTVQELTKKVDAEGEDYPDLRTGVAAGEAVSRGGDWFGAPINLASRLTEAAKPGTIFVEESVADLMGDGYDWPRARRKLLKGIGRTKYYRLNPLSG